MPTARAKDLKLSGHQYVPMRMKDDTDDQPVAPTKIASERRCEHETTVCLNCLPSWEADYDVFFDRTAGGRNLKARVEGMFPGTYAALNSLTIRR